MNLNSKVYVFAALIVVALLAVLGIAYFAAKNAREGTPSGESTTTIPGPGYTIQILPTGSSTPDLDRPVAYADSVPQDARAAIETQRAGIVLSLKADPTRGGDWLNLALLYHEADDFESARLIWEFLIGAIPPPENAVVYENLGKLYHFDLHDYPKAESYFRQAITADPTLIDPYLELYQLYRYSYKTDTTAAVDVLLEAAAKFPDDSSAYYTLGLYYRDLGQSSKARSTLQKAMDRARAAGDVDSMNAIGIELSKLPQ